MSKTKLPEKQRRFVEAFMGRCAGNAKQAAIAAGYSKKTAKEQASRLLTTVNVRQAIEAKVKADPLVLDAKQIQQFLSSIAAGQGAYILAQLKDRIRAAELLGKSHRMFSEHHVIDAGVDLLEILGGRPLPQHSNGNAKP